MITISYDKSLGGHQAKAQSVETAMNTLARKHRAAKVRHNTAGYNPDGTYHLSVSLLARNGAVIAQGTAYVTGLPKPRGPGYE